MKEKMLALLLSKDESYLVEVLNKNFNIKSGIVKLGGLKKKKYGDKIKTHLGKEFAIVKPNIKDILEKKIKRTAQVILPKDVALILAYTGIRPDSLVVDCGTGSGYLAIFLANYLTKGKVITYESDRNFARIAKENIKISGLKNIKLKHMDVAKGIAEKNIDLLTVDIQNPAKIIKNAYSSLKAGGYLVVYSPTVEEVIAVNKFIKRKSFSEIKTVENIVREWQVERTTRPKTMGLMHTGFLTFARKME
jgi:tRNA (adenine57-N1/adenine58-N1)-methyltransferase